MSIRTCLLTLLVSMFSLHAFASPLDDRIEAFDDAAVVPDQAAVTQLLKTGVQEKRSAEALAAVQAWLNRNDLSASEGLLYAGQAAERSGQWLDALGYYQRLLSNDKPNAEQAGYAVDATYRLLLNIIGDDNATYQFMRKDGNRIHRFGQANRYDTWFLKQAQDRKDLVAIADRLTTIGNQTKLGIHDASLQWFLSDLEQFNQQAPAVYEAARRLAAAKHLSERDKARLNWVVTVMPYNLALDKLRADNTPADAKLTDEPLQAAARLIKADKNQGPLLVAKGWGVEYDHQHSGNCAKRFNIAGDRKLAQLVDAMPGMSIESRAQLLAHPIARGRVSFDPHVLRDQLIKAPQMLDTLSAANVRFFDKDRTTMEDAKQLAPLLARSPHTDAAVIRAIASSGSLEASKIIEAMAKSEAWRFKDAKEMVAAAWNASTTQDINQNELNQQYPDLGDAYTTLKSQTAKTADSAARRKAFDTLRKDLLSKAPRIPGSLSLWTELFAQAPNDDTVYMIKAMTGDLTGDRELLLQRALDHAGFGDKRRGKMPWVAEAHHNQFRYHREPVQASSSDLIAHLRSALEKQTKQGEIQPTLLGMWLHTADLSTDEAKAFAQSLLASPAYSKLPAAYRSTMAKPDYFGYMALPQDERVSHPRFVSEPILNLPDKPNAKQVETALAEAITRANASPVPIAIIGLDRVAAAETWSDKTRQMVLSLFKANAPIGEYPNKQGYEPLIERLADDALEQQAWAALEPYYAGMWHAASAKDHHTYVGGVSPRPSRGSDP